MSDRLDRMLTAMIMACGVSKLSFKFNLLTKTASEPSKKFDLSDLNIEKIVWVWYNENQYMLHKCF